MKRQYLSYSALKAFEKSPNHYLEYVKKEYEPSPAMQLGSLVHLLTLEPENLEKRYAVAPEVNKRTKAGKEEYALFVEQAGTREVIDAAQLAEAQVIADIVKAHPLASQALTSCTQFEKELRGELYGYPFVAFADAISENFVYDLKTTRDASPKEFIRAAANLGYHLQAAIYTELTGLPFRWIAVETSSPYNVQIYEQDSASFERSRQRLERLVKVFINWDGKPREYSADILPLELPGWA